MSSLNMRPLLSVSLHAIFRTIQCCDLDDLKEKHHAEGTAPCGGNPEVDLSSATSPPKINTKYLCLPHCNRDPPYDTAWWAPPTEDDLQRGLITPH